MRVLNGPSWAGEFENAFRSVFRSTDPFDAPLTGGVPDRALMYPVAYQLSREEFRSLFDAAGLVGDSEVIVSITESESLDAESSKHYVVSSWEYTEYRELPDLGVLENAVYSPSGQWGMLISHEQHAVVGGTREFMEALRSALPLRDELAVRRFLRFWGGASRRHHADVAWVEKLLEHVFGPTRAKQLSGA